MKVNEGRCANVKWRFIEPGDDGVTPVVRECSEDEILATFYPWWQTQMRKAGKADLISPTNCINDWVVVHWAERVSEQEALT